MSSGNLTEFLSSSENIKLNIKIFGKNAIYYSIGNTCLRLLSFLLIPLYTYSLTLNEYGLLATLLLTIQIFSIFISMGMRTGILRFLKQDEKENLKGTILSSSIFIIMFSGFFLTTFVILLLTPFFNNILHTSNTNFYILLVCSAATLQSIFFQIATYYRAENKAKRFISANISTAILLVILNLILILIFHMGITGALISQIIAYGTISLTLYLNIFSKIGFGFSLSTIPKLLHYSSPLIFSTMGQFIMGSAGIYFISYFSGLSDVAIYSLGYKFAQLIEIALIMPFVLAYEPFVFSNFNHPENKKAISRLLTYYVCVYTIISMVVLFASKILLPIIAPPEYSSAYIVIIFILIAFAFKGLIYFGEALLNVVYKTHITAIIIGGGGILSFVLFYIFVPLFGWYGAIISTNISYIFVGLTIMIFGNKAYSLQLEWRRITLMSIFFFSFLFLVYSLQNSNIFIFISVIIILSISIFMFLYKSSFLVNKEKAVIRDLLQEIKFKIF